MPTKETSPRLALDLDVDLAISQARCDEDAIPVLTDKVVNVAQVPQRSPLRYPGGKTWLVPQIRKWVSGLQTRPRVLIEPFAGGATASLTAVMEGLVERAILCERDPLIANLWFCLLEEPEELATRVEQFEATNSSISDMLAMHADSRIDLAFQTLLRNRVSRGGIMAKGASVMKRGENGSGIASRWYPATIADRIRAIGQVADRLQFFQGDGVVLVDMCQLDAAAALFIDPPYTAAGKRAGSRLYTYTEIDHEDLFRRLSVVHGAFMMTYDESSEVIELARNWNFHIAKVPMKSTHHAVQYELLITPDALSS